MKKIEILTCDGCEDPIKRQEVQTESLCKKCRKKERHRLWRLKNPDYNKNNCKKWREAGNKGNRPENYNEIVRKKSYERYHSDPEYKEKKKLSSQKYREQHPEKVKELNKKWIEENREEVRIYHRNYQRERRKNNIPNITDPESLEKRRIKKKLYGVNRRIKKESVENTLTDSFIHFLHLWQDHCCAYCNKPMEKEDTLEHTIPIQRGGSNTEKNVYLVCGSCSFSKQDRLLSEWSPETIYSVLRYHSIWATKNAYQSFIENNIQCESMDTYIRFPNGSKVFFLSSFWMCDRLGRPSPFLLKNLINQFPDSIFYYDFEWKERSTAILNSIKVKVGQSESLMARNLVFDKPPFSIVKPFMDEYHLQGFGRGSEYFGLRTENGEWIGLCSVQEKFHGVWTIERFAFKNRVQGGFGKFVAGIKKSLPDCSSLVTFAESRLGGGNGYIKSGFVPRGKEPDSIRYVNASGIRHWTYVMRKHMPKRMDFFDETMDTWKLLLNNGWWAMETASLLRFEYLTSGV